MEDTVGEDQQRGSQQPTPKVENMMNWNGRVGLQGKPPARLLPDPLPEEDVLCVPPRLTKSAYEILVRYKVSPRAWNLEGRYGSRTHRAEKNLEKEAAAKKRLDEVVVESKHDDGEQDESVKCNKSPQSKEETIMGLPILSKELLLDAAKENPELQDLLKTPNVNVVRKPFTVSHWANPPPYIDARIHPERERSSSLQEKSTTASVTKASPLPPPSATATAVVHKDYSFTYAELFAGIGGFGVALDALGGQCVFCSELEENCRAVYEQNIPSSNEDDHSNGQQHTIYGDIYQVPDESFPEHCDLLVAGFPCQPFSALGTQPALDCPKGRGHLFLEIVRFLEASKPKAFILENVPGLRQLTSMYDTIISALENVGYDVCTEVCNARGITATSRKRLFFVGLLRNQTTTHQKGGEGDSGEEIATRVADGEKQGFEFPFIPDLGLRAVDVIEYYLGQNDDDEENIDNKDMGLSDKELVNLLRLSDSTFQQLVDCKRWRPSALAWPSSVLETLISHYGNAVGRGESQLVPGPAPLLPRRLSPRECARLMGFPNSYRLGPRRSELQGDMAYVKERYRMFGNAVCPPLIAAIAGAVLDVILPKQDGNAVNWIETGRKTAVQLAYEATIPVGRRCQIPIAAFPFDNLPIRNPNRRKKKRKLSPQAPKSMPSSKDHLVEQTS